MTQTQQVKLQKLRSIITENLRTQLDSKQVNYISTGHTLTDAGARQSHCIFARRGCGKTLLLHHSRRELDSHTKAIYINCEDFKHHTFPNVLIEILEAIFREIDNNLSGWFGRKKQLKVIIGQLRGSLSSLRSRPDAQTFEVKSSDGTESHNKQSDSAKVGLKYGGLDVGVQEGTEKLFKSKADVERKYTHNENKLMELNHNLPEYKSNIKQFFELSSGLKSVFIQIDDFYHLTRTDQPFVADYMHRLCKDTPLKFKLATLKHNSVLYIERAGQPIGIQERHDYQPINIDFSFEQFDQTTDQNRGIFMNMRPWQG